MERRVILTQSLADGPDDYSGHFSSIAVDELSPRFASSSKANFRRNLVQIQELGGLE